MRSKRLQTRPEPQSLRISVTAFFRRIVVQHVFALLLTYGVSFFATFVFPIKYYQQQSTVVYQEQKESFACLCYFTVHAYAFVIVVKHMHVDRVMQLDLNSSNSQSYFVNNCRSGKKRISP